MQITRQMIVVGCIGVVVGLLIGWLAIGWWLWPVQWTNALPMDLAPEYRHRYVAGVALMLEMTGNRDYARQGMEGFGSALEQRQAVLEAQANMPAELWPALQRLEAILPGAAEAPSEAAATSRSWWWPVVVVGIVALVGVGGAYWWTQRSRGALPGAPQAVEQPSSFGQGAMPGADSGVVATHVEPTSLPSGAQPGPRPIDVGRSTLLAQLEATFENVIQDYNESFNLTYPDGQTYAGDCGLGIVETMEPHGDQVTALEMWLFDKTDIRTYNYILASRHAFQDPERRERYEKRGQVTVAEPGQVCLIESKALQLRGRIKDVEYVEDPDLPEQSVFKQVRVELEVYLKPEALG